MIANVISERQKGCIGHLTTCIPHALPAAPAPQLELALQAVRGAQDPVLEGAQRCDRG
jgi:hypothetical protein